MPGGPDPLANDLRALRHDDVLGPERLDELIGTIDPIELHSADRVANTDVRTERLHDVEIGHGFK